MPPTAATVRRVAATYKMNRHKIPQNPRADDIRHYTVQYTLAAVFLRVNKIRPAVYHLKWIAKSLFAKLINLYFHTPFGLPYNLRFCAAAMQ